MLKSSKQGQSVFSRSAQYYVAWVSGYNQENYSSPLSRCLRWRQAPSTGCSPALHRTHCGASVAKDGAESQWGGL